MTKILCLVIKIDQCLQFYIYVLATSPRPKESGSFYDSVAICCVRSLFQHCSSCDALFRNGLKKNIKKTIIKEIESNKLKSGMGCNDIMCADPTVQINVERSREVPHS